MQFIHGYGSGLIGPPGPPPGRQSLWMRERAIAREAMRLIYSLPVPYGVKRRLRALWIQRNAMLVQRVQHGRRLYRR